MSHRWLFPAGLLIGWLSAGMVLTLRSPAEPQSSPSHRAMTQEIAACLGQLTQVDRRVAETTREITVCRRALGELRANDVLQGRDR